MPSPHLRGSFTPRPPAASFLSFAGLGASVHARSRASTAIGLALTVLFSGACGGSPSTPNAPSAAANASATAKPAPPPTQEEGGPVSVSPADPSWGNRNALVTIVEIADFECPFCARASATVESLRREYGPDKLRVVWKNLPLEMHREAKPAAEAAAAVMLAGGSDAFFKFHDKLFANQMALSRASYAEWAKDAGVDPIRAKSFVDSGAARAKVEADMAYAKQLHVEGTPAFFINGVRIEGAQPAGRFKAIIDVELEKARTKVGSGVAVDKLYAAISTENFAHNPAPDSEEEEDDKRIYKVPTTSAGTKSPSRGPDSALVTMVVFSDFQCPFCKRAESTMTELESRYPGMIRYVWKNLPLPFHPRAEPAAEFALEARAEKGDQGFWAAHKKLFDASPSLEDADFERIAKELSLDPKKVAAAVKTHKYKAIIDADEAEGEDFQAQGTPHFFVNGRRVVGARPVSDFVPIIDDAIARAKAALAKGAAPNAVYDEVIKEGVAAPSPEKQTIPWASLPAPPSLGNPKAPVTIVVFSDFQCPFCKRVEPTLAELRKTYGTKIRFVWKNLPLPFHPNAHAAAEAAVEAQSQKGDGAFWKMHDALFEHQEGDGLSRTSLDDYAKTAGLDLKRFDDALDSGKHKKRVDDEAQSANAAGIAGTPTFVIAPSLTTPSKPAPAAKGAAAPPLGVADGGASSGETLTGYVVSGAQPIAKFKKLIDLALTESGTSGKAPAAPTAAAGDRH